MACYDCEGCSKNVVYGGKCNRFEYNCPFTLVETYEKKELNKIRTAIKHMLESIDELKAIDSDGYMEDEISSIEFQVSSLKDMIDERTEKEWQEINK